MANTQSTGTNVLWHSGFAASSVRTLELWVKPNAWDKEGDAFGIFALLFANGPGTAVGFMQGGAGAGTENRIDGVWFDGTTFHSDALLTGIAATLGEYNYFAITGDGDVNADLVFHFGKENGPLVSVPLESTLDMTTIDAVFIGGSPAGVQRTHMSGCGIRLYNSLRSAAQCDLSRQNPTYSPIDSTGLIFDVPALTGTNPETARAGTSVTREGTLTTDVNAIPKFIRRGLCGVGR